MKKLMKGRLQPEAILIVAVTVLISQSLAFGQTPEQQYLQNEANAKKVSCDSWRNLAKNKLDEAEALAQQALVAGSIAVAMGGDPIFIDAADELWWETSDAQADAGELYAITWLGVFPPTPVESIHIRALNEWGDGNNDWNSTPPNYVVGSSHYAAACPLFDETRTNYMSVCEQLDSVMSGYTTVIALYEMSWQMPPMGP